MQCSGWRALTAVCTAYVLTCCVQEVRSLHGLASAVLSKVQPAAAGGDDSAQEQQP